MTAQTETQKPVCGPKHLDRCFVDLAQDQAGIWTSPLRAQKSDLYWIVPMAAATGTALYFDADAQRELGVNKSRIDTSRNISRFGSPLATVGAGAGIYTIGLVTKNEHLAETGRLGVEAVVNAVIVTEGLKLATQRERPESGDGTGKFWPGGTSQFDVNTSFPSGHAATSWALARVVASEYPGTLTKIIAYGAATTISVARVTGRDHFPSDVLVGSALGYLVGGYVYRHHSGEFEAGTRVMITPEFNQRTGTYGARLDVPPSAFAHPARFLRALR
jgi:membrane-associated phospholipid phosphatase